MFLGPLGQVKPWNTHGIEGVSRFLDRVWRLVYPEPDSPVSVTEDPLSENLARTMHKAIKKVTEDTGQLKFNTAIAEMMVLVNELHKAESRNKAAVETLLLLLSPYAPHICEELWKAVGHTSPISSASWPVFDPALAEDEEVTIAVQVNGKLRGRVTAPAQSPKTVLLEKARNDETVKRFLEGMVVVKEIVVPDRLVNLVVKPG